MEAVDRLAAFVAGELDPSEHAAVAAELAHDPALRAELEALRRADEALAGLDSPEPSEGFERRLDASITRVLAETLPTPQGSEAADQSSAVGDELAARRGRRRSHRWLPAAAGVAAGVAILAGVITLSDLTGGNDEAAETAALDADEPRMELFTQEAEPDGESAEAEMPSAESEGVAPEGGEADAGAVDAPVVVAGGRMVDREEVEALTSMEEVVRVADLALGEDEGRALAERFAAALGLEAPDAGANLPEAAVPEDGGSDDAAAAGEGAEAGERAEADEPSSGRDGLGGTTEAQESAPETDLPMPGADVHLPEGSPDPGAFGAATRCVDELLGSREDAIPVYVELASYAGDEAVLVGLVTLDPATGRYTQAESWAMDRATCQVLPLPMD